MTTVIGTIMLGLEPVVFLIGGVYAGAVYGGIVSSLNRRAELAPAIVRSSAA